MTRCKFCGIYYRCSTAEDYCSALCREKDENTRLKSQLEFAIGYIESYGLLTLFLKEKEMEGPK